MEGYDPDMGARPLRRVIQLKVEDRLSDAVLAKEFTNGDEVLVDLDAETGEIFLRKQRAEIGADTRGFPRSDDDGELLVCGVHFRAPRSCVMLRMT